MWNSEAEPHNDADQGGSENMSQESGNGNQILVDSFFDKIRSFTADEWEAASDRSDALPPRDFNDACDVACNAADAYGDSRKLESMAWSITEECWPERPSFGAVTVAAAFEIFGATKLKENGVPLVFLPMFGFASLSDLE